MQPGSESLLDCLSLYHIFTYIYAKLDKSANLMGITAMLGCLRHLWLPHEHAVELEACQPESSSMPEL